MNADTLILGAGPAGIGAALALGERATVIEGQGDIAGLSRTLSIDGVTFDLGGHSFHTPHPHVRERVFNALPMEEQVRQAWCHVGGEWLRYPFQKHFTDLADPAARAECAEGLTRTGDWRAAPDFDAHLTLRFGEGIARRFMRPYNRKLWGDLTKLDADWTAERVAAPAGVSETFDSQGGARKPLQADTTIAYPARGGFGEIFRALAKDIPDLRLGLSVRSIDMRARRAHLSDGSMLPWRRLVSTLPLDALLRLIGDVPQDLTAAVARLQALPVSLVMLVLDRRLETERQRVYSPDAAMPGHKIVLNNTSSNWLRAQPRHGIQVEVSHAMLEDADPARLGQRVAAELLSWGLLPTAAAVARIEVMTLAQAYPVPTHDRRATVAAARAFLAERDIHLAGRFAEWAYINADEALYRGMMLGEMLARN